MKENEEEKVSLVVGYNLGRDLNQIEESGFLLEKGDIWSDFSENDRGRTSENSALQKSNEKRWGGGNGQNQLFRTLGINQTLAVN